MTHDYERFATEAGPSPEQLKGVGSQAVALMRAAKLVKEREQDLKEAQAAFRKIAEKELPEALTAAGMEELKLKDGRQLKLEHVLTVTPN